MNYVSLHKVFVFLLPIFLLLDSNDFITCASVRILDPNQAGARHYNPVSFPLLLLLCPGPVRVTDGGKRRRGQLTFVRRRKNCHH